MHLTIDKGAAFEGPAVSGLKQNHDYVTSSLAICGKRRPFRRQLCFMIGVPAMLHHQTAVLHDLDASASEGLSNLVIPYS